MRWQSFWHPHVLTSWTRSARGDWLGIVNYELHYIDRRQPTRWMRGQLVPAYALQPRESPTHRPTLER